MRLLLLFSAMFFKMRRTPSSPLHFICDTAIAHAEYLESPESVSIGLFQSIILCSPPFFATTHLQSFHISLRSHYRSCLRFLICRFTNISICFHIKKFYPNVFLSVRSLIESVDYTKECAVHYFSDSQKQVLLKIF